MQVKLTKGLRGLGVTTDDNGVINNIDPNCPAALNGELQTGADPGRPPKKTAPSHYFWAHQPLTPPLARAPLSRRRSAGRR
eukprot:3075664-Prymnesium_polylepis.1